jgi:hypothetical protein
MPDDSTEKRTVDQMTPEELHGFFGVSPEGILKVTEAEWSGDYAQGVTNNADRWKRRTENTKKDIVALAIAAEGKYQTKMKEVIANSTRAKALKQVSTAEVIAAVVATPASTYAEGATKRLPKFNKKLALQYPLREYAKQQLDAMAQDTSAQRDKKLVAAKYTNLAIGKFLKGGSDVGTCRTEIANACK